ncbi:MAG: hypothetical protein KDJ38_05870 [Gammaproteobacteria bacterium]|nr:hypothetical protein [Gammaproteobacteria bacterium]
MNKKKIPIHIYDLDVANETRISNDPGNKRDKRGAIKPEQQKLVDMEYIKLEVRNDANSEKSDNAILEPFDRR